MRNYAALILPSRVQEWSTPALPLPEAIASERVAGLAKSTGKRVGKFVEPLRRVLMLVLVALFIRTFIGEAALVPTASMEGTILVGDHILLNKAFYGPQVPFTSLRLPRMARIRRGDIVAFHYPIDPKLTFLKRVAAVGGDVVEIRDGILYVNAVPVREPYVHHSSRWWERQDENMSAMVVPAHQLFVLGDNRDNSDDSRYWGTVPVSNVIGEPLLVYWSYDAPSIAWKDDSAWRQAMFYISIIPHIAQRSRWSRTGRLLW